MPTNVLLIDRATLTVTLAEQTHTREVSLPYHWDKHHPGQSGEAVFDLRFHLPERPEEPWSLYLPRLGNAYEISLNQTLLQRKGQLAGPDGRDYAQAPHLLTLAPKLLRRDNVLTISIRAEIGRRGGLSPVLLGPPTKVDPLYQKNHFWRVTGSVAVVAFSFLVGILAMTLWATQTTASPTWQTQGRDPVYLYVGLAELFWTLRVGDSLIETPPLPWPWWGLIPVVALGAWGCSMALFCMEVADWRASQRSRWFKGWLAALMTASPLAALMALNWGVPVALTLWYAAMGITFLGFGSAYLWYGFKTGVAWPHRLVGMAILFNVAVGMRDLYVFRINPTYGENSLMRYSVVLFGMALAWIVIIRFRTASTQARELMQTLQIRISEKEAELTTIHQAKQTVLSKRARTAERTRILRDMHDGVGAHISSAIRQLQQDHLEKGELLSTMHDALDQLKMSVDVLSVPEGDVNTLLASLRYRLEPRLKLAGIQLVWAVDALPVLAQLDSQRMRHLQFVLYEALSNVLQHAHAQTIHVEATASQDGVNLVVRDDGSGFIAVDQPSKGLTSMRERCRLLGAELAISSAPESGTEVRLRIPFTADA
ncbi:MAG: histidine kinase [Hydrogenophaga sp.]|uniref:sensor histidine kinase n=1 Tax=Hydrogenophaga sp. TaxID=1904254 RepID=UPI002ABA1A9D|nr:ATP-binding protein [Hydrogenophaga sp.]MDZ4187771.1 histidine kinase [Hydrogenophaga sp.]